MRLSKIAAAAVAGLTIALLAGCAPDAAQPDPNETVARGEQLTLTTLAGPTSFDVATAQWGNRSAFYEAVYDTVLRVDDANEVVPGLASEWSVNDAGDEITLTIREGVTFTDGSTLDAVTIAENLERNRAARGAESFTLRPIQDISAPDATTLVLKIAGSADGVLRALTTTAGMVQNPATFDSEDVATTPEGSGAYILDGGATVVGSSYVFTANPDYWDPDRLHYDKVVININPVPASQLNAMRAGEANGVKLVALDTLTEAAAIPGWSVQQTELDVSGFYLWDRDGAIAPELADVRVRQAINYAFDREALLEAVAAGNGTVTTQTFSPDSAAFDPELDDAYPYDPERARDLLAEAGYPDGFTLTVGTSPVFSEASQSLLAQYLADIGITVEFVDGGQSFFGNLFQGQYPATYFNLDQRDDLAWVNYAIASDAPRNPFRTTNPEVEALVTQIREGGDGADAAAAELNALLVEEAWFAPWYRVDSAFASDENTTFVMRPDNAYPGLFSFRPVS